MQTFFLLFRFNENFGTIGILDRLHGTDEQFRRSKNYERHMFLFQLTPARELVPDDQKGKDVGCEPIRVTQAADLHGKVLM